MAASSQPKERPILFSAPMVRAILEGRKTVTRRPVKVQPRSKADIGSYGLGQPFIRHPDVTKPNPECPYGRPGDRLWVRETFYAFGRWITRYSQKKGRDEWHFLDMTHECQHAYLYDADTPNVQLATGRGGALPGWYKRPAIFMPRSASRIVLENSIVSAERLQDISDEQAQAEGCFFTDYGRKCGHGGNGWREVGDCPAPEEHHPQRNGWMWDKTTSHEQCLGAPRWAFANLWNSVNGPDAWDANPWVWCVNFKRVQP